MTTRWRVIDLLEYSGAIATNAGRIVAGGQEFPLDDVACILTGTNTQWSSGVVSMAAKYDVSLLACDWRGVPIAATLPWSDNSRVATRQRAQADLSLPRRKNAWMRIIRAKVRGQADNLPQIDAQERLLDLAKRVRSGDPENLEAQAARTYWSKVFHPEQFSRNRELPGRNAQLNYGYTVLRGFIIRAICSSGLSPTLSVQHSHRANAFALADDLIEPFRPAVDFAVTQLPHDASPRDHDTKKALVGVAAQPFGNSGVTVQSAITDLAQAMAMYAEGSIDKLPVHAWQRPTDG